ncbi:MAG TPA: filamentous hemagglutinin N-terminal domain-containing protein, partial [Acidocella sp.]|nr:filamentous hemagglutinin N-terminal domain-containing protein [Acidocella sp.]
MNHVFKLVWNRALGMLVPVPEVVTSPGRGGRRLPRRARRKVAAQGRVLAAGAIPLSMVLFPLSAVALPTGGQVVSGQATLQTTGSTLNVNQTSQNATINYQSFNVGANETVNFRQPGASSITLNQVLGSNASAIYGHINANGQVFLVNPNGIYFAPGAQVNVGGLIASTEAISAQDLAKGTISFSGNSPNSVVNKGTITAAKGGYVAFIGAVVDNEGKIITPNGMTALGAGSSVDLSFSSNSLAHFQVSSAALNAAVKNGGAIIAPNGAVILTAQAKNALLQTVVNNTGIIQAQGVAQNGGDIQLLGGASGTVENSGTLDASSASGTGGLVQISGQNVVVHDGARIIATGSIGGGTISVGGGVHGAGALPQAVTTTVAKGAVLNASATAKGNGGTISVWSDVKNPNSVTQAYGTFLAQGGPAGGNGGFVETSGHNLAVTGAVVNTSAPAGAAGTWLLDPYNVTIASNNAAGTGFPTATPYTFTPTTGSTILNNTIDAALASGNVTITTGAGGSSNGNITVNAPISWSTGNTLTFNAAGNIAVNAAISATATTGTPTLRFFYGQNSTNGTGASYSVNAPISLTANASFQTQLGSSGGTVSYMVIDSISALQGISTTGDYVLGTSLNDSNAAFTPIGSSTAQFTGVFDGLGNTISNLSIKSTGNDVGLFGYVGSSGVIRDIGLVGGSVSGGSGVGGLVGYNSGSISASYATGAVTSDGGAGGKGFSNGAAGGAGGNDIGGLVGYNSGSISASYATG